MDINFFIGMILLLVFIIVPTLPLTYLVFKFIQDAIKLGKELREDYYNISAELQREELENYFYEQQQKEEKGVWQYYKERSAEFFQKYAFHFYVVLGIGFLAAVCLWPLLRSSTQLALPQIVEPKLVSFIFLPMQAIAFFCFICSKSEKRKWQCAAILAGIFALELLWGALIERSVFALEKLFVIALSLGLAIYYYRRWQQKSDEKLKLLQERLQESNFSSDELLQKYNYLQEKRHDTKKHFSVLHYLTQEQEINAMQSYINQLEQYKEGHEHEAE